MDRAGRRPEFPIPSAAGQETVIPEDRGAPSERGARPTMADVARAAGVSMKTVSRVVNDEPRVVAATRKRVNEAIDGLGFRRNDLARHLARGQQSATLGLVIEDLANPFSSGVAAGVEEIAREHHYLLILGSSALNAAQERDLVTALCSRRVDGLLIITAASDHSYLRSESRNGLPIVFLDRPPVGLAADAVLLDDRAAAREGVTRLVAQGHRRIGMLCGDPTIYTGAERLAAYKEALAAAAIALDESLVRFQVNNAAQAEVETRRLLALPDPPSAIFSQNNRLSMGVIRAYGSGPLCLLGFDDFDLADQVDMPVTVLRHDPIEMGRQGARLLFSRIAGDDRPPQRIVMPVELVAKVRPRRAADRQPSPAPAGMGTPVPFGNDVAQQTAEISVLMP